MGLDWPVAILAGGLATRLRPITEKIPKALLEVAGKPFVSHQLRLLQAAGFERVVMCVGFLGEMVEAVLGNGHDLGIHIDYSYDGTTLRGTGGALQHALPQLGDHFLTLYGDSYLPIDYRAVVEAFRESGKPALMTVFRNQNLWDQSNVSFEAGQIRLYSKTVRTPEMAYIDYGLGVISAKALAPFRDESRYDLADVYGALVTRGDLAGYEVANRFYEIGSKEGLMELDALLSQTRRERE